MIEIWLKNENNNFHNLVLNTKTEYPLCNSKEEALKYLKLIDHPDFFYGTFSNYDIIDYPKLIYIEVEFGDDEEIKKILNSIKNTIKSAFIYKHQYFQRITNPISKEHFNSKFDQFFAETYKFAYEYPWEAEAKMNKENQIDEMQ